jgi:tetratricopeptide (TPR) repeat protein
MLQKPILVLCTTVLLAASLFFFTKTISSKKKLAENTAKAATQEFDFQEYIVKQKQSLGAAANKQIEVLEAKLSSQTAVNEKVKTYSALASIWKDSANSFEPYAYYISNAAKLENSEKNLTFAARLWLTSIRGEKDEKILAWKTASAIALLEKAILLNPNNDTLRIDLGSAYIFGKANTGNPQETMKGIQEILTVARKDSANLRAQLMLGIGGVVSGQYSKAVERLLKVAQLQPNNVEAVAYLADAYAGLKNKAEAVKWYNVSKRLVNDSHYSAEVDERIKALK